MFSPTDCFVKNPDVVLRRLPEWRQCYAYTPARPEIYELNTTAWLIVELCEGQSLAELERVFLASIPRRSDPGEAKTHFHCGLQDLVKREIVIRTPSLVGQT